MKPLHFINRGQREENRKKRSLPFFQKMEGAMGKHRGTVILKEKIQRRRGGEYLIQNQNKG